MSRRTFARYSREKWLTVCTTVGNGTLGSDAMIPKQVAERSQNDIIHPSLQFTSTPFHPQLSTTTLRILPLHTTSTALITLSTTMGYDSRPYYTETYTIFVQPIRDPSPDARTFNIDRINRPVEKSAVSAFAYGLGAGLVGITALSITQTIEQHFTGRPGVRVPGESIARFFMHNFKWKDFFRSCVYSESFGNDNQSQDKGKRKQKDEEHISEDEGDSEPSNLTEPPSEGSELAESGISVNTAAKWIAYLVPGVILGGVRGVLSYYGIRGIVSDMMFLGFTSSVDQCPVWAQLVGNLPLSQIILDSVPELIHQTVYAFVTGFLCDHWVN